MLVKRYQPYVSRSTSRRSEHPAQDRPHPPSATAAPQTPINPNLFLFFVFFILNLFFFQTPSFQHPATTRPPPLPAPTNHHFRSLTTTIE
jgi:hypothetical protein